jgi:hypothetical protein
MSTEAAAFAIFYSAAIQTASLRFLGVIFVDTDVTPYHMAMTTADLMYLEASIC